MPFADPSAAESAFYEAFRTLDINLMLAVWHDSTETSCIHPGGALLQGAEEILASWREIFRDSLPPQVDFRLIRASTEGRLAVHTVEESVTSGGGASHAIILATNIYGRFDSGWRMLAHHASLPLVESKTTAKSSQPLH